VKAPIHQPYTLTISYDLIFVRSVWLRDLSTALKENPSRELEFYGFDISSKQFPVDMQRHTKFIVHDILEPFPEEHQGAYDLVNVRFVMFAIKAVDVKRVVSNIASLLST
jgi:hypothetical protein